jgi:hypothetical protein
MAIVEITPTRLSDVWAFEKMRPEDAAEVMALDGCSPVEAIIESWASSKETWTGRINGEVAAMFGVALHPMGSTLAPVGVAWALTTPVVDLYPVAFYRHSKRVVEGFAARHGMLINYVDARYGKAVAWLRRLGFVIHPPLKLGQNGELFHPIVYGG